MRVVFSPAEARSRVFDRRVPRLALLVVTACATVACTDPNTMFTGQWQTLDPVDTTWLSGKPELAIGHFGPELTGVIYYKDAFGVVTQAECPCAFIEHDTVDRDDGTFVATTEHCAHPILIWILTRTEDDAGNTLLSGTVGPDERDRVPIELELVDDFVPEDARACGP